MEKNVAVRIFKEQFDLIRNLPENERALVLYGAVWNAFNQLENQIDNQNEIQTDNQIDNQTANQTYLYLNHISVSLSGISQSILNLLTKTMTAKEFSLNYGGNRKGAGRPKKSYPQSYPQEAEDRSLQAKQIINTLANNLSVKNHSEIKGKTVHIVEGEFFMDETMPDYKSFLVGLSEQEIEKLWGWIRDKYYGQYLPVSKIQQMIKNFNTNLQKGA